MRKPCLHLSRRFGLTLALVFLAACSGAGDNEVAALDNELLANGVDPALTSALEDQILVDPDLVQQAHPNTVRPPETPVQAQYPTGSARAEAAIASLHQAGAETGASTTASPCPSPVAFNHDVEWARRLPAEFPLYPGGQVTEAAGADVDDCRVRVVTFTTADPATRVLQHYRQLATRAGFSAEHQQRGQGHVLGGVHAASDGAFYLIVTPLAQGSDVALIVNNGR